MRNRITNHIVIAKITGDSFKNISASVEDLSVCYTFFGDGFTWFDKVSVAGSMLEKSADELVSFFNKDEIKDLKGVGIKGCQNSAASIKEMCSAFNKRVGEIERLYEVTVGRICDPIESSCTEFKQKKGLIEEEIKDHNFSALVEAARKVVSAVDAGGMAASGGDDISIMVDDLKSLAGYSGKIGVLPKAYNKVFKTVDKAVETLGAPELFAECSDILDKMYTLNSGIDNLLETYVKFGKFSVGNLVALGSLSPSVARILFDARTILTSL